MGLTQDSLDLGKRSGITVYTNFFFSFGFLGFYQDFNFS